MKNKTSTSSTFFTAIIMVTIVTLSCNKKFDMPPLSVTDINGNTTIAALKSVHTATGSINQITDTLSISGTVVANDKSGNIYKAIYVADNTGGIEVMLNGSILYTSYPVGMHIFIQCQGLALSDYNGDIELGAVTNINGSGSITSIPSAVFAQYITPGSLDNTVPVTVVTLAQLKSAASSSSSNPSLDNLQNTLVQINNAEFADTTGLLYSDTSSAKGNVSRTVTDCPGGTTVIYTSGFANFAGVTLPTGGGTITAVYTPYKGTSELLVRDTSDVQFTGLRCNGSTGGGGIAPPPTTLPSGLVSLSTLRSAFVSTGIKVNSSQQITGVVISDASTKDISSGEVIIQQGNYGMSVYFGGTITYNPGDSLMIDISGDSLISYFGSMEVKVAPGATLAKPTAVATGKTIVPQIRTVAQLNASLILPLNNAGNNENTLVQIENATVTDATGPYYAKSVYPNLTDDNGADKIELFTTSSATFGSTTMPTTAKTWTGYGNSYKGYPEFMIRNLNDVQ